MNLRHHCIRLCGLEPESTRPVRLFFYEQWGAQGFPVGKPVRTQDITVTADQCHTGEYWSNFMLSNFVGRTMNTGRCMLQFL